MIDKVKAAKLLALSKLLHPLQNEMRHAPVAKPPTPEPLNQMKPMGTLPAYALGGMIPGIPSAPPMVPTNNEGKIHAAPLSTPKGLKESLTKKTRPKM